LKLGNTGPGSIDKMTATIEDTTLVVNRLRQNKLLYSRE
jgi:hypothetical protein